MTPAAPPTVEAAPQPLIARTRAGPVKLARMTDIAAGLSIAAPAPWTSRAPISIVSVVAKPPSSEPATSTPAPKRNIRRRPKTSAARPEISSSPPKVRKYALRTQAVPTGVRPRSAAMDGSATFRMLESSITTNCAATRVRTSGRDGGLRMCNRLHYLEPSRGRGSRCRCFV